MEESKCDLIETLPDQGNVFVCNAYGVFPFAKELRFLELKELLNWALTAGYELAVRDLNFKQGIPNEDS